MWQNTYVQHLHNLTTLLVLCRLNGGKLQNTLEVADAMTALQWVIKPAIWLITLDKTITKNSFIEQNFIKYLLWAKDFFDNGAEDWKKNPIIFFVGSM